MNEKFRVSVTLRDYDKYGELESVVEVVRYYKDYNVACERYDTLVSEYKTINDELKRWDVTLQDGITGEIIKWCISHEDMVF